MIKKYEPVIGLEIHLQLKTKSKMFSNAPNEMWQARSPSGTWQAGLPSGSRQAGSPSGIRKAEPNSLVTPVELGLPGALPVPNKIAIQWAQQLGFVLNCTLNPKSKFDRKNYFYPDLPKGYQISQYDEPLCIDGYLDITAPENPKKNKKIRIRRIHLEEDTAKSMHKDGSTYLDFNKSGVPLVELVTEPDFSSAEECSEFAKMIQAATRKLDISDADMEKGNLRLEANISVRKIGLPTEALAKVGEAGLPDYRIELKNINSFKFMRDAINYEIERQLEALEKGEKLMQETRGWDEDKGISVLQRTKEQAHDYRYFPEPDIPPLEFSDEYISEITKDLPKMPWEVVKELEEQGIRTDYAKIIAYDQEKHQLFIKLEDQIKVKDELVNIIVNSKNQNVVEKKIQEIKSKKQKKQLLSDDELDKIIKKVIGENPQAVADYKKGKQNAIKFLLGQVMKQTKGQAEPQKVLRFIEKILRR